MLQMMEIAANTDNQDKENKVTQQEATAILFAIFTWLRTTGKSGKQTVSRQTLLKRVTGEYRPNPATAARIAMNRMMRDTAAKREENRQKLAAKYEAEQVAKKAETTQLDPMQKMWNEFNKQLSSTK